MLDLSSSRFYMVVVLISAFLMTAFILTKTEAQADYKYLSTGIGIEARREKIPQDFTVKLVFASAKGELLANVKVDIKNLEGDSVLSITSEGPWLFVDLPQGVYNVYATFRDCPAKKEKVTLSPAYITEVVMRWDLKNGDGCPQKGAAR
jgi:hypothetical protein